jgi:hypothetical protein
MHRNIVLMLFKQKYRNLFYLLNMDNCLKTNFLRVNRFYLQKCNIGKTTHSEHGADNLKSVIPETTIYEIEILLRRFDREKQRVIIIIIIIIIIITAINAFEI